MLFCTNVRAQGWADAQFTGVTLSTSLEPGLSLTQPHLACPCLPSLTQFQPCTPTLWPVKARFGTAQKTTGRAQVLS